MKVWLILSPHNHSFGNFQFSTNFAPAVTLNLVPVLQEALNPMVKRAEETEAYYQLNQDEEGLWLTFEKNEKRFVPHAVIKSIEARIHLLEGYEEFDSKPSRGTTIDTVFPLKIHPWNRKPIS